MFTVVALRLSSNGEITEILFCTTKTLVVDNNKFLFLGKKNVVVTNYLLHILTFSDLFILLTKILSLLELTASFFQCGF